MDEKICQRGEEYCLMIMAFSFCLFWTGCMSYDIFILRLSLVYTVCDGILHVGRNGFKVILCIHKQDTNSPSTAEEIPP